MTIAYELDTARAASTAANTATSASGATWTRVCHITDLEPMWAEAALVHGRQVAVVRLPDDSLFAFSNLDPATGASVMARGIVGSRAGRPTIASPLHKDVYDLETGRCLTDPQRRLPMWHVRHDDDGFVSVRFARALVAASHGTSDAAGRRSVAALVQAVRDARPELDVADAFVDVQEPEVTTTIAGVAPDQEATVVPLLLSAGYHVKVDLAAAAADAATAETPRTVGVTGALGPDARLIAVLVRRLREAGLREDDRVVLAAAGSTDASAVADCHVMGHLLAAALGRPVVTSFISAAEPRVADAVASTRNDAPGRVVVATYLLAPGYFASLAASAGADVTSGPLLVEGERPPRELVDIVCGLFDDAGTRPVPGH
ncbi:nitrite reductase small subunit NirD [Leifsonia sp. NPDC058292]|uniref:nitrite reductase small subunit NirD n=1 Tax=Leifsonia sp. NPDC058292 TaxID=3346428 RepID=UPI0036DD2327